MSKTKESINGFRIAELFVATLLGSVAGKLFAIFWTLPDFGSQIAWSVMIVVLIVFSLLGVATFFYFVVWLIDSYLLPKLQRSGRQEATIEETEEEICDSLELRDEFRHRKI